MTTPSTTPTTPSTREAVQQTYSKGGKQYDDVRLVSPKGRLLSEHDRRLVSRILPADLTGRRVFECGAGTGRFTLQAMERGGDFVATDINQTMLDELKAKLDDAGLADRCDVHIDDIFKLSKESDAYDYVFCLHVIPRFLTLDDQAAALKELCRVTKPGGELMFNYRGSRSFYNLAYKGHAASPKAIEKVLTDAGMTVVQRRGKWFMNKSVLNKLPLPLGKVLALKDRLFERVLPNLAWDVFVVARKDA